MRVMISTVHIKDAVLIAITKLSPEKIIFLIDSESKKKADVSDIQKMFSKVMPIETVSTGPYDLVKIAADVVKVIENESSKGNEVILHITEGRKTMALGAMYAAYARKKMVKGIYYITEEKREVIALPILEYSLNPTKQLVLQEFSKGNIDVKKLAKLADKTEQMIYSHISSLKEEGYISADDKITNAGRIVIL